MGATLQGFGDDSKGDGVIVPPNPDPFVGGLEIHDKLEHYVFGSRSKWMAY